MPPLQNLFKRCLSNSRPSSRETHRLLCVFDCEAERAEMLRCEVPAVVEVVREAPVALKNYAKGAAEIFPTSGNNIRSWWRWDVLCWEEIVEKAGPPIRVTSPRTGACGAVAHMNAESPVVVEKTHKTVSTHFGLLVRIPLRESRDGGTDGLKGKGHAACGSHKCVGVALCLKKSDIRF